MLVLGKVAGYVFTAWSGIKSHTAPSLVLTMPKECNTIDRHAPAQPAAGGDHDGSRHALTQESATQ